MFKRETGGPKEYHVMTKIHLSKSPPRRRIGLIPPNKSYLNRKHLSISDFKLPQLAENMKKFKPMMPENAAGDDLQIVAVPYDDVETQ